MGFDPHTPIADVLAETRRTETTSLVAQVHDALRTAIVEVRLAPGRPLSDREIAAHFGISKTPVREALLRLVEERLVVVAPRSGTRVAPIDIERFKEGCFARFHLERAAVMRAAELRTDRDVIGLRASFSRQKEVLGASDFWSFFLCDEQFHALIFEAAGLGGLVPVIKATKVEVDRIRSLRNRLGIRRIDEVMREHEEIIEAIALRDPERAARAIENHLGDVDRKVWQLGEDHRLWDFIQAASGGGKPGARAPEPLPREAAQT